MRRVLCLAAALLAAFPHDLCQAARRVAVVPGGAALPVPGIVAPGTPLTAPEIPPLASLALPEPVLEAPLAAAAPAVSPALSAAAVPAAEREAAPRAARLPEPGPSAALPAPEEVPDSLHPVRGPNRLGYAVRGLLAAFSIRTPASGPASGAPAVPASGGPSSPGRLAHAGEAAPPSSPELPAPAAASPRRWLGPAGLLASFGLFQVALETLNIAIPSMAQELFDNFTIAVNLTIATYITELVGRQAAPALIKRWGLTRTYLTMLGVRAAMIGGMAALYATGGLSLPWILAIYSAEGFLDGIQRTSILLLPPAALGQDQAKLERFETWHEILVNIAAMTAPPIMGLVALASGSFLPLLLAYPATMLLAGLVMLPLQLAAPPRGEDLVRPDLIGGLKRGFQSVWGRPLLRNTMFAYTFAWLMIPLYYAILGPGVGLRLTGNDPGAGASVFGWLTSFYSVGFLVAAAMMVRGQRRIAALAPAEQERALNASLLGWMGWGLPGLLAIAFLALPWAPLPGGVTIQGLLAMIPLGIAQMFLMTKLRTLFQSRVPEAELTDAAAFFGAFPLAVAVAVLIGMQFLFLNLSGLTPFWVFSLLLLPAAAGFLALRRSIARHL